MYMYLVGARRVDGRDRRSTFQVFVDSYILLGDCDGRCGGAGRARGGNDVLLDRIQGEWRMTRAAHGVVEECRIYEL